MEARSDGAAGNDGAVRPFDGTPGSFDELIESVGPSSLLVVIEGRMGAALRARYMPEDVFQEAMLHAWRDRHRFEWRGLKSFRAFLLSIIDNRIRDLTDRAQAQKRGGGIDPVRVAPLDPPLSTDGGHRGDGALLASTTPSRIAAYREERVAMHAALDALPDDLRDVVRLRLFEQMTLEEVASRLGMGESAARHRFRKGAALYRRKLEAALAARSSDGAGNKRGTLPPGDSSPSG